MTQPSTVTVPPSFPKLLGRLVVANLCMAGGIFMVVGWGMIQTVVCALAVGLSAVHLVLAAVMRRPRVVITPEGFGLIGDLSYKWEDVDGPFAVIKIGWSKTVAYKLTADCKARVGKKPTSRWSGYRAGYDEVVMGAFTLSAEELAALLNEHKRRSLPSTAEEAACVVPPQTSAAAQPAPAEEAQAQGNGSPILRVAAGVLAVLVAVMTPFGAAKGMLDLAGLVLMEAFALMFGWYAVRGRKGLPRFLTKKLGA